MYDQKSGDPYKTGYCDAVIGRPCASPWTKDGYKHIRSNSLYLAGYLKGEDSMKGKICTQPR